MHYGYILRGQLTGLFKVGITKNVSRRMSAYKTHTPERIIQEAVKVFISEEEAADWESMILEDHADAIEHGEWLNLTFEEMAEACCTGNMPVWKSAGDSDFVIATGSLGQAVVTRMLRCENWKCAHELSEFLYSNFPWVEWTIASFPREIDMEFVRQQKLNSEERNRRVALRIKESAGVSATL